LKGEGLAKRKKIKDLMDMYKETIDLAKFTTRIFLPFIGNLEICTCRIETYGLIYEISMWSYNPSKMI
jgi:hypothetical protein